MDAPVNVFELLLRCDSRAQAALCSALCQHRALAAARLACGAARTLLDGSLQSLHVALTSAAPAGALAAAPAGGGPLVAACQAAAGGWGPSLERLEGVLSCLATRWQRATALHLHISMTQEMTRYAIFMGNMVQSAQGAKYRQMVEEAGARLQELLCAALLRQAAGAQRLAALHVRVDGTLQLAPVTLAVLLSACPGLTALDLSGEGVRLAGRDTQLALTVQCLAGLPRLSSLGLPATRDPRALVPLAGQLTRLVLDVGHWSARALRDYNQQERDARLQQMLEEAAVLRGLPRLAELMLVGLLNYEAVPWERDAVKVAQALFASLPPSLQRMDVHHCSNRSPVRLSYSHGQLDAVELATCSSGTLNQDSDFVSLLRLAGVFDGPHKPRLLRIGALDLSIKPGAEDEDDARAAVARVACAFRELRVGHVAVHLPDATAGIVPALLALGASGAGGVLSQPDVRLLLRLRVPVGSVWSSAAGDRGHHMLEVRVRLGLPSGRADAGGEAGGGAGGEAGDEAGDEAAPTPEAPAPRDFRLLDLLLPYACTDGSCRHLLLVSNGLCGLQEGREEDQALLQQWLEAEVARHAPYARMCRPHPHLPAVALEFSTPEGAAAAAGGLLAAGATFRGRSVAVVPASAFADRQWLRAGPLQALKQFLQGSSEDLGGKLHKVECAWRTFWLWANECSKTEPHSSPAASDDGYGSAYGSPSGSESGSEDALEFEYRREADDPMWAWHALAERAHAQIARRLGQGPACVRRRLLR